MPKRMLYTAGYAGLDPETFLQKLREHEVAVLVDVRNNPVSRKPGFSKSRLKSFLESGGLEYDHYPQLGAPKPIRDQLHATKDLPQYFAAYRRHLAGQEQALADLRELALQKTCCLMCLEQNPQECHRSVLAEILLRPAAESLAAR